MSCISIDGFSVASLVNELTDVQIQGIISGRLSQRVVEFTTVGTNVYNKPSDLVYAFVVCIGAGGGGGSGRMWVAGVARSGGSGGSAGCLARRWLTASAISNTETITIGSGGTGGAGVNTSNTEGNVGNAGNDTLFGTLVIAKGGSGGNRGTTTAISPIASLTNAQTPGQFPLSSGNTAGAGGGTTGAGDASIVGFSTVIGNNGGGGSGANIANTSGNGGNGSRSYDITATLSIANNGGGAGNNGNNGFNNISLQLHSDYISGIPLNTIGFGTSGSGGAGSGSATNSGDGGDGGLYGAGAGGGGAATFGDGLGGYSGDGGDGAQGCCIVFEYYV